MSTNVGLVINVVWAVTEATAAHADVVTTVDSTMDVTVTTDSAATVALDVTVAENMAREVDEISADFDYCFLCSTRRFCREKRRHV